MRGPRRWNHWIMSRCAHAFMKWILHLNTIVDYWNFVPNWVLTCMQLSSHEVYMLIQLIQHPHTVAFSAFHPFPIVLQLFLRSLQIHKPNTSIKKLPLELASPVWTQQQVYHLRGHWIGSWWVEARIATSLSNNRVSLQVSEPTLYSVLVSLKVLLATYL